MRVAVGWFQFSEITDEIIAGGSMECLVGTTKW